MAPDLRKRRWKTSHSSNSRDRNRKYEKLEARHDETLKHPIKLQDHMKTVSDLVYQYLENLANVNDRRKQRHNARNIFHRAHKRKQPRGFHPDRHIMDSPQFPRSSVSKKIVDDYAKAADEGKNTARKYVYKALSFAVHSGFLVPVDDKGQILRVSSNLYLFQTPKIMKKNKTVEKIRYDPTYLKKMKTNSKIKKPSLKLVRIKRLRQVKKKTKKIKARK